MIMCEVHHSCWRNDELTIRTQQEENVRIHMRVKGSVPLRGEMYVWPLLRTGMRSFSERLWFVVLNSHTSTNGWGALICVRTIRKKCALLEWSAVNAPLYRKATFFFEQLRSIIRFIPECANTTSYWTSVKWISLPNNCTLSWPGLRAELYIYIYTRTQRLECFLVVLWNVEHVVKV